MRHSLDVLPSNKWVRIEETGEYRRVEDERRPMPEKVVLMEMFFADIHVSHVFHFCCKAQSRRRAISL